MKMILVSLLTFTSLTSFAQMPDTEALKAKATTTTDTAKATAAKAKEQALINLNTAKAEDLAKLPGIGATRAKAIIDARPYANVSDLKKVKGIKEGVIAKLKDYVTVK